MAEELKGNALRQHYKAAALTGILANPGNKTLDTEMVRHACKIADMAVAEEINRGEDDD